MFTLPELQIVRAALDHITIKGADSKFLTQLQLKVEQKLRELSEPKVKEVGDDLFVKED
jgi:hypothetical protein